MSATVDLFGMFAGRRQAKMASGYEKARAHAALAQTNSEIAFRNLEDPREQAELRQSMAARGLGRSSINDQAMARQRDIQARRMAALRSQRSLQEQGLSLIRKQRKYARRMFPLQVFGQMVDTAKEIGTGMGGSGSPMETGGGAG